MPGILLKFETLFCFTLSETEMTVVWGRKRSCDSKAKHRTERNIVWRETEKGMKCVHNDRCVQETREPWAKEILSTEGNKWNGEFYMVHKKFSQDEFYLPKTKKKITQAFLRKHRTCNTSKRITLKKNINLLVLFGSMSKRWLNMKKILFPKPTVVLSETLWPRHAQHALWYLRQWSF